ncbi:MAG: hypothetical protein KAI74_05785 [Kiritimatiellae bacterium]|nr:hypothetical protein [Kiritimatiellia bacterium]
MVDEKVSNDDALPPKVNLQNSDAIKIGNSEPVEAPSAPAQAVPVPPKAAPVPPKAAALPPKVEPVTLKAKPVTLKAKPATLKAKPISKSETSKIPLDVASGITIVDDAPHTKTIKIKPVASPATIKIGAATAPEVAPPAAVSQEALNSAKSKTSKISLDSVLPDGAASLDSGPKTIRLKRPSVISKPAVTAAPKAAAVDAKEDLSKTSRLDVAAAEATPTRRKTIRVKRPTTSAAAPALNVARPAAPASAAAVAPAGGALPSMGAPVPPSAPASVVEEKCIVSGIASIFSLLVVFVLIYVLLAQLAGADRSLSRLSYFMPEMNLSWPGKILGN